MTGARHADLAWADSEGDGEKMAEVERGSIALGMWLSEDMGSVARDPGPRRGWRRVTVQFIWRRAKTEVRFKAVGVATRRVRQPPA